MENKIILKNVGFIYENDKIPVLNDVSLTFDEGSFVAVLGHNGSGKSTMAKHLNAILLPTQGSVSVFGMDTKDPALTVKIRQSVGMVFQNPDNQLVATVVEEDVAFAPENLGVPPEEIRKRVDNALSEVNMSNFRLHAPHMLSGGQKQRIAIAGCLAMQPRCIVLDEPTAMLDPSGRKDVMATIKRLNRELKTTIILITHFMDEAALSDRVVVMDSGNVILDGPPRDVFSKVELLKSVGLDVPQTTELVFELNKEGLDLPLDILSDDECADALLKLLEG